MAFFTLGLARREEAPLVPNALKRLDPSTVSIFVQEHYPQIFITVVVVAVSYTHLTLPTRRTV